ncbi:MAG: hypothetical protein M0P00_10695, partial [Bacteroidaceae bacterium]|nr:hypothetical protein [Bacteroidaceae bacterium]
MKSIKYLMVALTLTMSVFLSSCLNGSSDNTVTTASILKYSLYTSGFVDSGGFSYQVINSSLLPVLTGNMYYVKYQYDSSLITSTSKSVNITLLSSPTCIDGLPVSDTEVTSTAALYGFQYSDYGYLPTLFDKNTLIIPIIYWYYPAGTATEIDAEVAKHIFNLYYVANDIKAGDTALNLYITHQIKET